jgi:hypothetical protein
MNLLDSGTGMSGFNLASLPFDHSTRKPDTQIETEPVIDRSLR